MIDWEPYYEIADQVYVFSAMLLTAYCYVYLIRPFLSDAPSGRLQKMRTWLIAAAYVCIMLFLHYMPYYINAILAYGIGIFGAFFVMWLFDPVCIKQKFFLSVTFFSLRWQAWRIVGQLSLIWYPFCVRLAGQDRVFLILLNILDCVLDALTGFFLMYGGVRFLLKVYGKRQEHMQIRELLILLIPSFSGICAYMMILFYYNASANILDLEALSEQAGYAILILVYAAFCYATTLATIWLFRQWKNEHEEDKRREVFSRQMQDLEAHITETERLYKDMRTLRHDMGNHLMTLKQLYAQREYQAAEEYAEALTCEMQKASLGAQSGNPVTDVILSDRKKEMEEKGIAFSCDFHYPADSEINAFDISIILNNGLANAIEAIERENAGTYTGEDFKNDNRVINKANTCGHISLSSYRAKNMYVIEISNSYTGALITDEQTGLPLSTKSGEGHGFGLSSIRQAARKYLGDVEIKKERIEDRECCVLRVMLQVSLCPH